MIEMDTLRSTESRRVDTCDIDAARAAIGEIFCPHFLTVEKASQGHFHARHNVESGTGYSVNLVSYGSAVEIDPGELSRFFLLQIPLNGEAKVRCGTREVHVAAGKSASLLSPTLATRMRWGEGCEKFILLIDRAPIERFMEALTHEQGDRIEFEPLIDTTEVTGHALVQHAMLMASAITPGKVLPPQYTATLRDGLASLLLTGLHHNRTASFTHPQVESGPAAVRKADEFIRSHACGAIAAGDIAAAAGVPLRTLQDSYRKARGMTLIEALQGARLEALRESLLNGDADMSVADAVFSCGLGHLGRAASAYRERYGESPSQTLRRSRN